jgi:Rrf2 family iron-sulfur cluster assembly transcriptional regulator
VKINNKAKIATVSMIRLAMVGDKGPVSLAELSARQGQSISYLEQVFSKLMKAGLVKSARGPGGGYKAVSLDISVFDIVTAINDGSKRKAKKATHEDRSWDGIGRRVGEELKKMTLAELIL